MAARNTLLLVGHKTATVRRAKALGLEVILLQHKTKLDAEQPALADATFVVDYTDWSIVRPLAEAAHDVWELGAALSLTEPGLEIAGRINDLLGLGATGYEASHRLRDKWAMRRHLAACGERPVAAELVDDAASIAMFGAECGYPFVVKPTDLTAGYGVLPVSGPAEVARVWAAIEHHRATGVTRGTTLFQIRDFLMEEYVAGPEFSVEGFSFGGRHVVIAITEKLSHPAHYVELGHALPARLEEHVELAIVAVVTRFLDLVGLRDGPTHTEVRMGDGTPVVIESHNRIGGDRIGDLVLAAYGIDLADYALRWPFGLVDELPDRPEPLGGACVRFLQASPGRVEAIGGIHELRAEPDVIAAEVTVSIGDQVRALQDNWDRLGLVAVRAHDTDAAVARCEALAAAVRIETSAAAMPAVRETLPAGRTP